MNRTINLILDPGHGGVNSEGKYLTPGKQFLFPSGEIAYEGEINRHIVSHLGMALSRKGFNVVYTVHPNVPLDVSLDYRTKKANSLGSENSYFISIHNNAAPTPGTARGFEIFTSKGLTESDKLALAIFDGVKPLYDSLGIPMRSDTTDGDSDKEADFYVLNNTKMPAVLVEVLFFDNEDDYKYLRNRGFIIDVSQKIADSIEKYIKTKD